MLILIVLRWIYKEFRMLAQWILWWSIPFLKDKRKQES